MRCTSCGLPLSPARTQANCPRCGTPIAGVSGQQVSSPAPIFAAQTRTPVSSDPFAPSPASQPGQSWQAGSQSVETPLAGNQGWGRPPMRPQPPRNPNLGFMVAGICVIIGGLILIFVYFMATGLQKGPSTNGSSGTPTAVAARTTLASPTAVPSPTPTPFPGQQYIDNAQMATAVDPNGGTATQPATTFKVNQKIYVTFQVHPGGQTGAVCLLWYLNGANITHYEFAVSASSTNRYSYAIYGSAGPAYVEIYWASSTQCTDKILAQHVDFTVTS